MDESTHMKFEQRYNTNITVKISLTIVLLILSSFYMKDSANATTESGTSRQQS
jgi:hypothetical protein